MLKFWLWIIALSAALTLSMAVNAEEAKSELSNNDDRSYQLSAYVGGQTEPAQPALAVAADIYLNPYLSFGPLIQAGFWNSRSFVTFTAGGTFHFPILDKFTCNLPAHIGYFYRHVGGFTFNNFVFISGLGLDYQLKKAWTVAVLFLANISSDTVDDIFLSGLVGVKYTF